MPGAAATAGTLVEGPCLAIWAAWRASRCHLMGDFGCPGSHEAPGAAPGGAASLFRGGVASRAQRVAAKKNAPRGGPAGQPTRTAPPPPARGSHPTDACRHACACARQPKGGGGARRPAVPAGGLLLLMHPACCTPSSRAPRAALHPLCWTQHQHQDPCPHRDAQGPQPGGHRPSAAVAGSEAALRPDD